MRPARLIAGLLAAATGAAADPDPDPVRLCLSCHLVAPDRIDIVGLEALANLPEEWPFLFEDPFDMDGDGVAGEIRIVHGRDGPSVGIYGRWLSAGSFEDFATIAGAAHGVDVAQPETLAAIRDEFEALSPMPDLPSADDAALRGFEARGCTACHVTHSFEHDGRTYMPLSDFLLHDLGDGPRRTAPLWGCPSCLEGPGHPELAGSD